MEGGTPLFGVADLNQGLARPKQRQGFRQRFRENGAHRPVRRIPTRNPDYLGRRAEALQQVYEVPILRHDHRARFSGGMEYLEILGRPQHIVKLGGDPEW